MPEVRIRQGTLLCTLLATYCSRFVRSFVNVRERG